MITKQDILMGRDKVAPLTAQLESNLSKLVAAINQIESKLPSQFLPLKVTSGYRPAQINANVKGAASHSAHMTCEACDFSDPHGALDTFLFTNQTILEECGLYMEAPASTPTWTHLSTRKPLSGNRVFKP